LEFTNSGISETVYQHFLSERNAINTNRYNFLQEKQKLLQKYYDGILNKETVEKRLYNLAEGKYPISPHERQTYLAIPDVLNARRQR
jgi:predicted metal-dependent hydrolase